MVSCPKRKLSIENHWQLRLHHYGKKVFKKRFSKSQNEELYRWIVDTSSSLYPELVDDFLYVLFLDKNPDIRLFANLRAKGLLNPKPLAQKLSVIANSQLTITIKDFLLFCENPERCLSLKRNTLTTKNQPNSLHILLFTKLTTLSKIQ